MTYGSKRRALLGAALSAMMVVTACGGSDNDSSTPTASAPDPAASNPSTSTPGPTVTPETVTVSEYIGLRFNLPAEAAAVVPDADQLTALRLSNQQEAVSYLTVQMGASSWVPNTYSNAVVVPSLTHASLRTLVAAARGDTLTDIDARFDLAPTAYVAARQTERVESHWWADSGRRFRTGFLAATDALGSPPRLAAWLAGQTGFADASAGDDTAFVQSLAFDGLTFDSFTDRTDIHLLGVHALRAQVEWAAVEPFDGVFQITPTSYRRMPLLRLTAGVTRHAGTDFTADILTTGDLRLMTLRPSSGSLKDFAEARLAPALASSVQALMIDTAVQTAGEMVLPQTDMNLSFDADLSLREAGISLAYDKVLANMQGLDGLGGTSMRTVSPLAPLHIDADGLTLRASHAMAFTFSPLNVNGGGGGFYFQADSNQSFCTSPPIWPTPHLRSFFLVLLDAQGWVVSIAAVEAPVGELVEPTCPPFSFEGVGTGS